MHKKVQDIQPGDRDFNHGGKCYCNLKHSPAVANEYAFQHAAQQLLALPDDEAMLGNEVITDGNTCGTHKFIEMWNKVIGEAATNIMMQLPNFTDFIKSILNGHYKLAAYNPALHGVELLDPSHICSISAGVVRHIHMYHDDQLVLNLDDEEALD